LYAEGQRRYVESLSAYARQFLQLMEKPDVDLIEGCRRDIDRAEGDVAQSALDRGHRHRDPRLPAPALRPRGRSVLSDHPEQKLAAMTISQMVDSTLAMRGGRTTRRGS
jgi:excinuclease UvrABC ATPase subunit